ncbi:toxin [Bifidobacterium callimiconis]|uniref:Toxin n=1 Tax=Bifidobacterium callimiconis TaxID=2306973 RepID=A0A430FBV0_9BIFI|nr:toxin [Bifidobacterium callimiconis]RSX50324.1 toxin [Bifidobacterium callimiconis]
MYYNISDWRNQSDIQVYRCALKHGIDPDDSLYVAYHPQEVLVLREDPPKMLCLGFTQSGTMLEVIVLYEEQTARWVLIHAMKLRKQYRPYLERGGYRLFERGLW